MSNLPLGAEYDQNAPFNEKSCDISNECPICEGSMEYHDSGSIRVYNRIVEWIALKCNDCGHIESNEPDIN